MSICSAKKNYVKREIWTRGPPQSNEIEEEKIASIRNKRRRDSPVCPFARKEKVSQKGFWTGGRPQRNEKKKINC